MKIRIAFLYLVLFFTQATHAQYEAQIKGITQELSKKIAETGKKRIAVADFSDADGSITKLGQFISEEFNTYLPEAGQGFEVIDRSRINILMRENKLAATALTNPANAVKLSTLAGIESLVYGTITPFSERVQVNIKILDLQRGVILRSFVGNITRTADINALLNEPISSGNNSYSITDIDENEKKTKDPDKGCAANHTGTYCFQNTTKTDIRINAANANFIIHPGQTECQPGILVYDKGEYTYTMYIYRNAKEGVFETRQIVVTECQKKTFVVR